jgi:hypothetical protein
MSRTNLAVALLQLDQIGPTRCVRAMRACSAVPTDSASFSQWVNAVSVPQNYSAEVLKTAWDRASETLSGDAG